MVIVNVINKEGKDPNTKRLRHASRDVNKAIVATSQGLIRLGFVKGEINRANGPSKLPLGPMLTAQNLHFFMGKSDQMDAYVNTVVTKYAKKKAVLELEEEDQNMEVVGANNAAMVQKNIREGRIAINEHSLHSEQKALEEEGKEQQPILRPKYLHHTLPSRHKVIDDRHWLYSTGNRVVNNPHSLYRRTWGKGNVLKTINVFGWGSAMETLVRNNHLAQELKGKQDQHGLGYNVGSPSNNAINGMWQWNKAGQIDGQYTPTFHPNSEAEWDRITATNTAINSNEKADDSTAYLIKHGNQRALAIRSVNSKEELEQLLAYQQELLARINERKQQERNDGGNKRSAGLEMTRTEQYQQRKKLEEQATPTFAHFGMVTSGTHQQSYSQQFNEQLGGDQHRLYPDIVLTYQPSIHRFSHGSGGAGENTHYANRLICEKRPRIKSKKNKKNRLQRTIAYKKKLNNG